jgi:hypothetical protein
MGRFSRNFYEISFSRKSGIFFAKIFTKQKTAIFAKILSIFAKMFSKTKNAGFRKNLCKNLAYFSRKRKTPIFAKIFAKMSVTFSKTVANTSVAEPDPVGSGPFWSDPDQDVRIRIRAFINDSVSTFLVCIKTINT